MSALGSCVPQRFDNPEAYVMLVLVTLYCFTVARLLVPVDRPDATTRDAFCTVAGAPYRAVLQRLGNNRWRYGCETAPV